MTPKVTAVLTTHARPLRAAAALASIRAEDYPNLEIIVVDDGGMLPECTVAGAPDVRLVRGTALGVARARNTALCEAQGEFFICLDDDDVGLPHRISTLVHEAVTHDAALVLGMTRRVIGNDAHRNDVPTNIDESRAICFDDLLRCNPHVNAVLTRTAVLRAAGGFDEGVRHFDDWAAWLRVADRGVKMRAVHEVVAEWRLHDHGLSAEVLRLGAMKGRLLVLFDHLACRVSARNAATIARLRTEVAASHIQTYDDYARLSEALESATRRPIVAVRAAVTV